jgi:hypothetical protein
LGESQSDETGSRTVARPALVVDRVVAVIAVLLVVAAAIVSPIAAGISGMRSTGCAADCDLGLVGVGGGVILFGTVAAALLTVAALVVAFPRVRFIAWIPCCGLVAVLVLAVIGDAVIGAGVGA